MDITPESLILAAALATWMALGAWVVAYGARRIEDRTGRAPWWFWAFWYAFAGAVMALSVAGSLWWPLAQAVSCIVWGALAGGLTAYYGAKAARVGWGLYRPRFGIQSRMPSTAAPPTGTPAPGGTARPPAGE